MLDHGFDVERVRFLNNNGSLAGAWLFNVPRQTQLHVNNRIVRTALKLRLGVEFNHLLHRCCCLSPTNYYY